MQDRSIRRRGAAALAILVAACCVPAAAAAPLYRLSVLDTPPGVLTVEGRYINGDGVIAGDLALEGGTPQISWQAFRWSESGGYEFAPNEQTRYRSAAVNLDAAGNVQGSRFGILDWRADGSVRHMGRGTPLAGNTIGDVVGRSLAGTARIWTADGRTLGTGAMFQASDTLAINDRRVVAGTASRPDGGSPAGGEAALWSQRGHMRYLGTPPGHPQMNTRPAAIGNDGTVVGGAFDYVNGGLNQAFRWTQAGGFEFLGQIPECAGHGATALNERGTIVGSSVAIAQGHGCGWVWTREDGIRLLHDLVDPADPRRDEILLQFPTAINERGQIVGRGRSAGNDVTFVLTPIDSPR